MSAPKRYEPIIGLDLNGRAVSEMGESTHGHYVTHSDYAALAAENERLKAELDRLKGERK